jgi:hypothetical protein
MRLTTLLESTVEEVRTAEDGMTFLRALRDNPRHYRIPVLVVTSKELTAPEMAVIDWATTGLVRKGPSGEVHGSLRDRLTDFIDDSTSWH